MHYISVSFNELVNEIYIFFLVIWTGQMSVLFKTASYRMCSDMKNELKDGIFGKKNENFIDE